MQKHINKLQRVSLPLKSSCSVRPHVSAKSEAFAEVPGEPLNKSMANVLASIKTHNILNHGNAGRQHESGVKSW